MPEWEIRTCAQVLQYFTCCVRADTKEEALSKYENRQYEQMWISNEEIEDEEVVDVVVIEEEEEDGADG